MNEAVKWDGVVESARIDMTKFSREQLDFGTFEEEFTPRRVDTVCLGCWISVGWGAANDIQR